MDKNITKALKFFLNKGLEIKKITLTTILLQNDKVSFSICTEDGYLSYVKIEDLKNNSNKWDIYHETNVYIFEDEEDEIINKINKDIIEDIKKFIGGN